MSNEPSCEVCRNAPSVVIVADPDLTERAVCSVCWHTLERDMPLTVIRFPAPYGMRSRA